MYWTVLGICSRLSLFWWLSFVYFVIGLCICVWLRCLTVSFDLRFMWSLLLFWVFGWDLCVFC